MCIDAAGYGVPPAGWSFGEWHASRTMVSDDDLRMRNPVEYDLTALWRVEIRLLARR